MNTQLLIAPNAGAEANLALAKRFLHAVNSKNADALVETMSADCVYELRTSPRPLRIGARIAVPDGRSISFDGVDICPVAHGLVTAKISYVEAVAWYEKLTFQ